MSASEAWTYLMTESIQASSPPSPLNSGLLPCRKWPVLYERTFTFDSAGSTAPELNCRYLPMNIIDGSRASRGIINELERRLMAHSSRIRFRTAIGTNRSPMAVIYHPLEGLTTIEE